MKKIKRVLAMIMAMAMVMGLSMTVSAASEATITISNAGDGKFAMVQVVEADSKKDTGWDFVDDYADEFLKAFGYAGEDTDINRQRIIKGMISAKDSTASEGEEIKDFANKYAAALAAIAGPLKEEEAEAKPASELTVTEAGLYVIQGFETKYVYSPMAVFVGLNMTTGGTPGELKPEAVNAKKQPTWTEKKVDDPDKITEIGRTLTYTVTSTVPYFADTETNKQYWVSDVILKGAEYFLNDNGKLNVTVKVGDGTQYNETHEVDVNEYAGDKTEYVGKSSFSLNLTTELKVAKNTYANQTIEVSYQAKVTDVLLHNDAMFGKGAHKSDFGKDSENLVTAKVTFVKTGDNNVKLNDAVFVLTNGKTGDDLRYASFTTGTSSPTAYKFAGWLKETEAKPSGTNDFVASVKLTTGGTDSDTNAALGTFTVSGLDYKENGDTTRYKFVEIQAPDGYSINETNSTITWDPMKDEDKNGIPDDLDTELTGDASMADTKLANLPGTGGIGTTIFTIGGCAIMIAAAGLYFASRRKQENK